MLRITWKAAPEDTEVETRLDQDRTRLGLNQTGHKWISTEFTDRIASRQRPELIPRTQVLQIAEIDFTSEAHVVLGAVHRPYDPGRYPLDAAKMPSMIRQEIVSDLFYHSPQLPPGQLKVVSSVQLGGSRTPFPSMI